MSEWGDVQCPQGPHPELVRKVSALSVSGNARFDPPPMPTFEASLGCLSWASVIWSAIVVASLASSGQRLGDIAQAPSYVVFTLLVISLVIASPGPIALLWFQFSTSRGRARHETALTAWRASKSEWDHLYYCTKDDLLFTPTDDGWLVEERPAT